MTSKHVIKIKRYKNRKLYSLDDSTYVRLPFIAELVRQGKDFVVTDHKGIDITRTILCSVIFAFDLMSSDTEELKQLIKSSTASQDTPNNV